MAFCTNCGRELIPGQKCVCQQTTEQQNNTQQVVNNQTENRQNVAGQQLYQQNIAEQQTTGQQAYQQNVAGQQVYQQTYVNQPVTHQIQSNKVQEYFKLFCDILANPKTYGKKLVKEANIVKAFIFICIQAVLSGIFIAMKFGKINTKLESIV